MFQSKHNIDCPVCYEQKKDLLVCQNCNVAICPECIKTYNETNNNKKCLCPNCAKKYSLPIIHEVYKNDMKTLLKPKIDKYRAKIVANPKYIQMRNVLNEVNNTDFISRLTSIDFSEIVKDYVEKVTSKNEKEPEDLITERILKVLNEVYPSVKLDKELKTVIKSSLKPMKKRVYVIDFSSMNLTDVNIIDESGIKFYSKYIPMNVNVLYRWDEITSQDQCLTIKFFIKLFIDLKSLMDNKHMRDIDWIIKLLTNRYHDTSNDIVSSQLKFIEFMVENEKYNRKLANDILNYIKEAFAYSYDDKFYKFIQEHIYSDFSIEAQDMINHCINEFIKEHPDSSTVQLILDYIWNQYDLNIISKEDAERFSKCEKCEKGIVITVDDHLMCCYCGTNYCKKCYEVLEPNHKCSKEFEESLELIKKESKQCPKCGIYINKNDGCNHMFCTNCHCSFDWTTGKEISESVQTNPLYFKWKNSLKTADYIEDVLTVYERRGSCARAFMKIIRNDHEGFTKKIEENKRYIIRNIVKFIDDDTFALNIFRRIHIYKMITLYIRYAQGKFIQIMLDDSTEKQITDMLIEYKDHINKFKL